MLTVEIDFEVFKALTALRETESMTPNDVIRSLLNLPPVHRLSLGEAIRDVAIGVNNLRGSGTPWIYKGVRFPEGTEFRAGYQGRTHRGIISEGYLKVDGQVAASPSDAARLVTGNSVNGWTFWECRFPGQTQWRLLKSLRTNVE